MPVQVAREIIFGELWAGHRFGSRPDRKETFVSFSSGFCHFVRRNFRLQPACRFCQNWEIAQAETSGRYSTEELVALAESAKAGEIDLAFTYSEPLVWYSMSWTAPGWRKPG